MDNSEADGHGRAQWWWTTVHPRWTHPVAKTRRPEKQAAARVAAGW